MAKHAHIVTIYLYRSFLGPRNRAAHSPHVYPFYKFAPQRNRTQLLVSIEQSLAQPTAFVCRDEQLGMLKHNRTDNAVNNGQPIE